MSKRSANDELLGKVLASHDPAMQELNFLNTVLGFLSRKTKFLEHPNAAAQINSIVNKQIEKAKQKKKSKKSKNQSKTKLTATTTTKTTTTSTSTSTSASEASNSNESDNKNEVATSTGTEIETQTESGTTEKSVKETGVGQGAPMEIDTTEGKDDSGNEDNDDGEKLVGNGGRTDKYVWTQTLEEVELKLDIPKEKSGKDCIIKFSDKHLKISLKGEKELILDGELHDKVSADDCSWMLDEEYGKSSKTLTIILTKAKGMNWWSRVIVGDAEIDTKKIEPANSKLDDLEPDVRQTVEKMMFDQRAKAMGQPTSKEREQQKILEKFKAQHPEMDFSNVKFG